MTSLLLTARQKAALRSASREAVESAAPRLTRYFTNGRWLGFENWWLRRDLQGWNANPQLAAKHLGEYLASAAILHCAHAWSFLGRSIRCHAIGDSDRARHFAYYSELRAAMGLLAGEGIAVLNNRHFALSDQNRVVEIPRRGLSRMGSPVSLGTHAFSWLALEHWSGLSRSADRVGSVVVPEGTPLSEWLDRFGPSSSAGQLFPIGREWLTSWGLDLRRLSDDQAARNRASYRVGHTEPAPSLDVHTASSFLVEMWRLCEPATESRFSVLDRHLLRRASEQAFYATQGRSPKGNTTYASYVNAMVGSVGPPGGTTVLGFLTRHVEVDDPPLLRYAAGTAAHTDDRHHAEVMARAALLLRIATGSVQRLIRAAGLQKTDIEFWWRALGEGSGLWTQGTEREEMTDMWADVDQALEACDDWTALNPPPTSERMKWLEECAVPIGVLEQCERITLWGMGL